jgi:3-oxoadipate enol-lactonase
MTGQWMGANAPERINKLILANTSCYFPDPTNWEKRIAAVTEGGIQAVADTVANVWLTPDYAEQHPELRAKLKAMMLGCDKEGYLACCNVLRTLDQRELLPKIKAPTLVIAGRYDNSTPVAASEYLRKHIPNADLTILDAAHISNVEKVHDFTEAVVGFLNQK